MNDCGRVYAGSGACAAKTQPIILVNGDVQEKISKLVLPANVRYPAFSEGANP